MTPKSDQVSRCQKARDQQTIADTEKAYEQEIRDFERFWYLGERFRYLPLAGYAAAPFESDTLNINSWGFRGAEFQQRNVFDRPRIGFFGPSAVFGIPTCNDGTTMAAWTQTVLKENGLDAEVLNLGVISARIGNEMRLIAKFLSEVDLDFVVLMSGWNDAASFTLGNLWEFQDVAEIQEAGFEFNRNRDNPLYFLKLAWEAARRRRIMAEAGAASKARFRGAEQYFRRRRAKAIDNAVFVSNFAGGSSIYLTFLGAIADLCHRAGKPLLYLPQPTLFNTSKELSDYESAARRNQNNFFGQDPTLQEARIYQFRGFYRQLIADAAEKAKSGNADIMDIDAAFKDASAEKDVFYDESHYLTEGNRLIGVEVAAWVLKRVANSKRASK